MVEELFIRLNDCFTAGYTLPQYCVENNIKRPLFVSEKKFETFLWSIYVQFYYDKRLQAQFCFIDAKENLLYFPGHSGVVARLPIKNISAMKLEDFDKIILLTKENVEIKSNNIVRFAELELFFIQRTYVEIPLFNFLQRYPKVKLILTNFPSIYRYKGGAEFNSTLYNVPQFVERLLKDRSGNVKTSLDKFGYTNEQVLQISDTPKLKVNLDGSTVMIDDDTKPLLGIKNGKRMTAYQPDRYVNKIYFFGQCMYFGVYAPFDKTIESYLQKMLNEANLPYRVENESQFIFGRTQDLFYNLNKLTPAPGDIIFVVVENRRANNNNIPFFDVNGAFDPPHDYREVFCVIDHINELGYKLLAEKFFSYLTANNFFRDVELNYHTPPRIVIDMVYLRNLNRAA